MYANKGDTVILMEVDQIRLQQYVGQRWRVEAVMFNSHPESALISLGDLQATAYLKNLEVVPPPECPFEHGETVKIIKVYPKTNFKTCDKSLIGKVGKIRGYDSRIDFYCIRCPSGESGWFPASSLVPLDFKGERFYYPLQKVKYRGNIVNISQTKRTKFNFGQLLLIDGNWVPSTDVEDLSSA